MLTPPTKRRGKLRTYAFSQSRLSCAQRKLRNRRQRSLGMATADRRDGGSQPVGSKAAAEGRRIASTARTSRRMNMGFAPSRRS